MKVHPFFHTETGSFTYVVSDSGLAMIIDPVLDYRDGEIGTSYIDDILTFIEKKSLKIKYIFDTHIHADHLSAAGYIKHAVGGKTVIGKRIYDVYAHWKKKYGLTQLVDFDYLVDDASRLNFGSSVIEVIETPGHTPSCVSYKINNHIFVGDTLFSPDRGTSRTDFPGGSAESLFSSIKKLYTLPNNTIVYLCHDYPPNGSSPISKISLGWQKKRNVMLRQDTSKKEYVLIRNRRDDGLKPPHLLSIAVPFNLTYQLPKHPHEG
ncbi:MBL fold metallo-hydrolase [Enterovibrio sp. ZSDZ35]|uniref:MBL fold metallo-hydrolase n=1 Tax=Enterovibrio qingdaonensis TaxID=2899818 RepID=A0ABT5QU41_9GAMM|nr:MBL fold metallo-hydrolase [Enterovibrio sp. ZSDZ35]MDD1784429.1 MBL fold metallo-hydrolase [Enterovibrio sp. ZSDZ35]